VPIISGKAENWGTSKDSYARGDTATGYVYVTNTGNVPIDKVDFSITVNKLIWGISVGEISSSNSQTGLNIKPGEMRRLEFSQSIPAEYSGISTAGDYKFAVTASLAGKTIGSFTKNIRVT